MRSENLLLSVQPGDLLSTFRATGRPSIKFCELPLSPGDIMLNFSTFSLTRRPSINLRQHSAQLEDLPLTFVNFPCSQKTFHQLSVRLGEFPSISSNFPSGRPSVNFCTAGRTFINFFQMLPGELQSTFCATRRPPIIFHQLSVLPGELPSTSINILYGQRPSINSVKFSCG